MDHFRKLLSSSTDKWHLFYTALLFFNNFVYGLSVTITNSTMLDIGHIYSATMNTMSYMAICISIGYLVGSFASYLYAYINRQVALIVAVLAIALCTSLLPHYTHLFLVFLFMLINGLGSGCWDSTVNHWLTEIWPNKYAAVLQVNMFLSGLGDVVAPLMVAPYVHGDANVTADNETITVDLRIRHLTVPFALEGVLQSIVPLIFLVTFFINRYQAPAISKSSFEEITSSQSVPFRRAKLALIGIAASISMAGEMGYIIFSSPMWQQIDVHLSASEAVQALSIFTATYTLGRLVTAFISLRLQPDVVISYHFAIIFGALAMLFFGRDEHKYILIGNALLGYGYSAMWASFFAFTEKHLTLTSRVCSFYSFMSGAVSLVMPLVLGQLFNDFPIVVFAVELTFVLTSLLAFSIVSIWIKHCSAS